MTFVLEIPGLKLKVLIIISITEPFSILQSGMHLMLQAYTVQQPTPKKLAFNTSEAKKGRKGTRSPRTHRVLSQDSWQVGAEMEIGFRSSESQPASSLPLSGGKKSLKLMVWSLLAPGSNINSITNLQFKVCVLFFSAILCTFRTLKQCLK